MSALAGEILIVTGPPGAGKTTMARALADRFDLAVLLEGDRYFSSVVRGWIAPWTIPARHQNTVVTQAMAASAGEFARGGYAVVLEGIIGPWFLDTFVPAAGGVAVHYLIVQPRADIAMARAVAREAPELVDPAPIAQMYEAFESHGGYERHMLDTSDHTVDDTVDEVLKRLAAGALRLDHGTLAPMKVVVVGGGIGGCALALSLHAAGIDDVDVYEAVSEVRELGVGVNVLPHAARELIELGLGDELAATAIRTAALVFFNRHGQRVFSEDRGEAAGYSWPQYSIHRGELLGILHRAVCDRLGPERYHTGHHVAAVGGDTARAWAEFVDRRSGTPIGRDDGHVLVGCDGVHSVVRASLYGDEGPPLWNGITMWRGVTDREPLLDGRTMVLVGHMERRMVIYPISRRLADEGRSLVNWVAELKTAEGQPMPKQDWEFRAGPEQAATAFADFRFDWVDVPELIHGAEAVFQYPMVDRDPLPQWTFGRITLLGDAAHPMYPVGSNGASQAIVDARVLAHHLATSDDIDTGLTAYEEIRRPLTAKIVLANRNVGPERMMELAEQRAPDGFRDIHDVVSEEEMVEISSSYKRMAGFDAAALNERPSWSVPPSR